MNRAADAVRRGSDAVNAVVEKALLLSGGAISAILFAQVVARYAGRSLSWSEEVGRHLLVAITFLGATVAYKRSGFIGLKGFGARLGPAAGRAIVRILQILTLACFLAVAFFGARYTATAWEQTTSSLQIPMSIPFVSIPLSAAVFALHVLSDLFSRGRDA
ncbi:MAG: hypothetical protein OHK0028_21850 [Deltaproteobacteria bacterium]